MDEKEYNEMKAKASIDFQNLFLPNNLNLLLSNEKLKLY